MARFLPHTSRFLPHVLPHPTPFLLRLLPLGLPHLAVLRVLAVQFSLSHAARLIPNTIELAPVVNVLPQRGETIRCHGGSLNARLILHGWSSSRATPRAAANSASAFLSLPQV
jgi:hypothetical protein